MASVSIRTGYWIDWSDGKILGGRVTMSYTSGAILIAFVALFDALVGNIFWNLLAFIIHRRNAARNDPRDGLQHQLQVLLRNSNEPVSFAQNAALVGWQWRGKARRPLLRAISLSLLAIIVCVVFSAAGVLSSLIASSGGVLLTGASCGFYSVGSDPTDLEGINFSLQLSSQDFSYLRESVQYAQSCYVNPSENQTFAPASRIFSPGASCEFYIKPALNWTTTFNNPCPFADPSICSVPESEIIKLDTGFLDSRDDFGFNTPDQDRLLFRRVETCSPITITGFSNQSFVNTGYGSMGDVAIYSYGAYITTPITFNTSVLKDAVPLEWLVENNATFLYPKTYYEQIDKPYYLLSASNFGSDNLSYPVFIPDPRIAKDIWHPVSLFFLANRAEYTGAPVTDPWFQADTPARNVETVTGDYIMTYHSNRLGSVMGCLEQAQICNPNSNSTEPHCSDLNTWWTDEINPETAPGLDGLTDFQSLLAQFLLQNLQTSTFHGIALGLGPDSLLASKAEGAPTQGGVSPALPKNQWQVEIQNWMAIGMASLLRENLAIVTGPTEESIALDWTLVSSLGVNETEEEFGVSLPAMQTLCSSQKIRNTAYQTFSVVGLSLNFAFGGAIMIAGLFARYAVPAIEKRRISNNQRGDSKSISKESEAWLVDGLLQLQRMAYEKLGLGTWEGLGGVPVTEKGQRFPRPMIFSRDGVDYIESYSDGSDAAVSLLEQGGAPSGMPEKHSRVPVSQSKGFLPKLGSILPAKPEVTGRL